MVEKSISIIDIAKTYGKRPQSIHKIVRRLGISTEKVKSKGSRGQAISYVSEQDYERIWEYFTESGNGDELSDINASGVFYLIQLEHEHDPGRYKLGFASSIEERLRSDKTSAPFAKVVATWPCKLLWEKTAIESVTTASEKLYTEVFRTKDIQEVRRKCDEFFALMPNLD